MGGPDGPRERDRHGLGPALQRRWAGRPGVPPDRRTRPPFAPAQVEQIAHAVEQTEPADHQLPGHTWTLKKLAAWVRQTLGRTAARATLGALLRAADITWKKVKKLLGKANPEARAAHVERLGGLFDQCRRGEIVLIWADESHFHRDMDLGYTWARRGKRAWRKTDCPKLSERVNGYGAYDFTAGRCLLWERGNCDGERTALFWERVAEWQKDAGRPVVVIWDGAPCHRAKVARRKADDLKITLVALPGYSPDRNPIERLWSWLRQEVTSGHCHATLGALADACQKVVADINADPVALVDRLWPKFELDPEYEAKLRVST